MFRTQGTKYELTKSKMETKPGPGQVPVPVPVPEPLFVAPKAECHNSANRVTLVRKSTLYQDLKHSYTKYGDLEDECEPNDNESHQQKIPVPVVANFDTPALKTLMMTALSSSSSSLGRKGISKKRFPMPGASSTQSQLFWCMFIACKGETAFDTISNAFVSETEFKYETVELLRGIKHIVKPAFKRYKLSIPNFEAELISSKRTPIHVATGIALAHQKNILYIDDRLFIEITLGGSGTETTEPGTKDEFAVIEKVKNRYCVYNDIGGTELERCRRELLKMESIESPVRSISYYKVPDLEEICKRLAITTQLLKGAKKADLYAEILKYIQRSGITV
jgi:hypothetical protein